MARRGIGSAERERRRRLVAKWLSNGGSAAEFGERHGVPQRALYSWARQIRVESSRGRQQRGVRSSTTTVNAPEFVPVRLVGQEHGDPAPRGEGVVEIRLRGGDVIRVVGEVSAERLRAVVESVRQAC